MADTQTSALIGSVDSKGARASIPLLNATGILHVSLGAGYMGFTERSPPTSPSAGTRPARRTFARLVGDDRAQARALVQAAGARRIVVEAEGDDSAQALAAAGAGRGRRGGRRSPTEPGARRRGDLRRRPTPSTPRRRGERAASRRARASSCPTRWSAPASRAARRPRAAHDAVFVSRAPDAGLDAGAARVRGRLRAHLRAQARPLRRARLRGDDDGARGAHRGGPDDDAGTRQRVIDAFFGAGTHETAVGPLTLEPDGVLAAPRFSAYRVSGGSRVYRPDR